MKIDIEKVKKQQEEELRQIMKEILSSTAKKKLIISGPGTGKTSLFQKILEQSTSNNNLVMTFIRKLVSIMEEKLSNKSEVKTFHAYCKKILYKKIKEIELIPYLSKIIQKDAYLLEKDLQGFDTKIRVLDERSPEVSFYLARGDYYKAVAFDDSVYRILKLSQDDEGLLPNFNHILIDEFQDFNPLEVAFINEIEKKGNILIVGDDDQAVYDNRSSSPNYIREKYHNGQYANFKLPFSFRCTQVVVDTVNSIIQEAQNINKLKGRISDKRFECFLPRKEQDSKKYREIIFAQCSTVKVVASFIANEISNIDQSEIIESNNEKEKYPLVLITGQKQYLDVVFDVLSKKYKRISFEPSEDIKYSLSDAYKILISNENSNLGWRILVELLLNEDYLKEVVQKSENGTPIWSILDKDFKLRHKRIIKYLRVLKKEQKLSEEIHKKLKKLLGNSLNEVMNSFLYKEPRPEEDFNKKEPTIVLTSRKGCKGLSAGFVFILGMNNGEFPRNFKNPSDVEISELIVGLSRVRKCCYLISNKWFLSPKDRKKNWRVAREPSIFTSWIPTDFIQNKGYLKANNVK